MKNAPPQPADPKLSSWSILTTTGVCCAIFLAALVGGFLDLLNQADVLKDVGDGKLEAALVCFCALIAGACSALTRTGAALVGDSGGQGRARQIASASLIALPCITALSLLVRWLILDHAAPVYLDAMLRGFAYTTALCALALVAAQQGASSEKTFLAMVVSLVAASTIAAGWGLRHYLISVIDLHIAGWREFGTSTPDYFAAFLLITLPVTAALFLAAADRSAAILYGICAALQLAAIPTTGSRFALVTLAVEIIVFATGGLAIHRRGQTISEQARPRLIAVAVIAIIGAVGFAGPVLHRLHGAAASQQTNSGAFRVYTWKGSLALAAHYPLLGTGPNLFEYAYPRYAHTGFTRVAHSGYLQLLDDVGPLGVAALLAACGSTLFCAARILSIKRGDTPNARASSDSLIKQLGPDTAGGEALILVGLATGALGSCVQNIIDSDWWITISGATSFVALGLTLAQARRLSLANSEPAAKAARGDILSHAPVRIATAAGALILAAFCAMWCLGAWQEDSGNKEAASKTIPLDGEYAGAFGYSLAANPTNFEPSLYALMNATELTPNAVEYRRLADVQNAAQNPQAALSALRDGLRYDPHSLPLLLLAAQISANTGDTAGALEYYRQMAALQTSPYGTVPALGEIVEYRYAYADLALAQDTLDHRNYSEAISLYLRAKAVLDSYRNEGGSSNAMRLASMGATAQELDTELQSVYIRSMSGLAQSYDRLGQPAAAAAIRAEAAKNTPRFIQRPPAQPS